MKPIVIVGGGLAGLTCATKLAEANIPFELVDAGQTVGGKLRTHVVEDFRLDHSFGFVVDKFPHLAAVVDVAALDLRAFRRGAYVWDGSKVFGLDLSNPFRMARCKGFNRAERNSVGYWNAHCGGMSVTHILNMDDATASEMIDGYGFSDDIKTKLVKPLYRSLLLDHDLQTPAAELAYLARFMAEGSAALPAKGMEELPKAVAERLKVFNLATQARVEEVVVEHGAARAVRLDTGERYEASAVVLATDALTASKLAGRHETCKYRGCATCYFETPVPVVEAPMIVVNGSGVGIISHVAPLTNLSPDYAPTGRHLISATVLGMPTKTDAHVVADVQDELQCWFPNRAANMFRFLAMYREPMARRHRTSRRRYASDPTVEALVDCTELAVNETLDGAIQSGIDGAALAASALAGPAAA